MWTIAEWINNKFDARWNISKQHNRCEKENIYI